MKISRLLTVSVVAIGLLGSSGGYAGEIEDRTKLKNDVIRMFATRKFADVNGGVKTNHVAEQESAI
jgi:hypothetical protein